MLTVRQVFRIWLPLAASWALMGAEGPLFTWTVAGMAEQKIHLAAFGSIAFPIALVVEGPIIMLLGRPPPYAAIGTPTARCAASCSRPRAR